MRIIFWIVRFLAILLLIRIVLRMLFSGRRPQSSQGSPPPRNAGSSERIGGELVRDPNCGTYIPKSRAIIVGSGDNALYFCSEKCREAYKATV